MYETVRFIMYGSRFCVVVSCLFFFNDTATTEIYTLSLHDALPISSSGCWRCCSVFFKVMCACVNRGNEIGPGCCCSVRWRSEEHTSELQSRLHLVCRLLLEKKKHEYSARDACLQHLPRSAS